MNQPSHPARFWHPHESGDGIVCDLCPRRCHLHEGQRGLCFVRQNQQQRMVLTTYGRSSGFCIDPIEKKPLHHFLPGSRVLSFGTAGCNLHCRFCQNWDISRARSVDRLCASASPETIARQALRNGCASVAFTYNDPVIFLEYAEDTARACRELGVRNVAVTAGYIEGQARRDFFRHMDAANVDLKAFSDTFYQKLCAAHLQPVLDTLRYIRQETDVWLELTTLLIPGHNDDEEEWAAMSEWVVENLGADTPWHFTAFHPDWRMRDVPPTMPDALRKARAIARRAGLRYVYTGNVHDEDGGTTYCPACAQAVIVRDWYEILDYRLDAQGRCQACGQQIPGVFTHFTGAFGAHRIPLREM